MHNAHNNDIEGKGQHQTAKQRILTLIQVVLKENANVDAFKKSLSKLDAKIETEFNIFKGFQYVYL
jgi:hypothetical protein